VAAGFRATYRLQLGPGLDFATAETLVPYLRDLGVSHLYLSPSFQAREEFEIASSTTANDPAATFNQVTGAVDRLAKSFASTIVTSILEAF